MLGASAARGPLRFEFRASGKGFLRADTHGGKGRIKTGAREGFFFGQTGAEENGEAANEGVTRASCVNGLDGERLDQFRALGRCQQRTAPTESDHHAAKPVVEQGGGAIPSFWAKRDGEWMQTTMFEEVPLPLAWPAYVSNEQASAYASWRGARLMTEPEFHRAAYGTPDGLERPQPWGNATPSSEHGNFGCDHWDPVPVGTYPAGASEWGVHELVGNGWEWTSTVFAPLPGFTRMVSYPGYSADFFDGDHYVMKGASAVTSRELIRRSFRNWFRPNYPYVYAKFRLAK